MEIESKYCQWGHAEQHWPISLYLLTLQRPNKNAWILLKGCGFFFPLKNFEVFLVAAVTDQTIKPEDWLHRAKLRIQYPVIGWEQ